MMIPYRKNKNLSLSASKLPQMSIILILILMIQFHGSSAILNCLTPSMFRMGTKGSPMTTAYDPYQGYRGSPWGHDSAYAMGYSPFASGSSFGSKNTMKKSLFQPRWRAGLLGGPRLGLMGGWMGLNAGNFYRPGYGYNYNQPANYMMQQNQPGYSYPTMNTELTVSQPAVYQAIQSGYNYPDSSWSLGPAAYSAKVQQNQVNVYDGPAKLTNFAPIDSYVQSGAGTKGVSLTNKASLSTTTRNFLVANGGYDFHDAQLIAQNLIATNNNFTNYGYSYPDWYSTSVSESPARIAQQLLKNLNLRSQRLEEPILGSDVPKFVGIGRVEASNNNEARLTCSFDEPIDRTNRPIWIKFSGPLSLSTYNGTIVPSFSCVDSKCRTQQIDPSNDPRYQFENGLSYSTLIIKWPRPSDYGIYRCSTLTKANYDRLPTLLETRYQIVRFAYEP